MSKITIPSTSSGYNLSVINASLQQIAAELNTKVLYRANPSGEPNSMGNTLDMNGYQILNLPAPATQSSPARLQDVQAAITGLLPASLIPFTPTATIAATTVQSAIEEVDAESVAATDLLAITAAKGADIVGFSYDVDYDQDTVGAALKRARTLESFGVVGSGDESSLIQAAIDWAIDNSTSIVGAGSYSIATGLVIRQDRLDVPINQDFASFTLDLNQLTYTGSGRAISVASPTATVNVKKLIGPGTGTGSEGLYITGQGDGARHRVDWVKGFDRNIHFDAAYSHTVMVGYVHDALIGIRINGNANRLFGGRIGGQFSTGATDSTTCEVGVNITAGSSANEIYANIEYCRRSSSAIGLLDEGGSNYFRGYIESNNQYNIHATGNDGIYDVINAGNNNANPSGYNMAGRNNKMRLLSQNGAIEETPSGSVNTLEFLTLTPLQSSGTSTISTTDGYGEFLEGSGNYRNELLYTHNLTNASWSPSVLGAALWASVTASTGSNGYSWGGSTPSTRLVFPASAGDADIYRISQSALTTTLGVVNFGIFAKVISGEVEVMVRLLEVTNNKQTRSVTRLKPTNKFVRIGREFIKTTASATDAVFEISFRSRTGGTIDLTGAYLVNQPGVHVPPSNLANTRRTILPGRQVDGNMFPAGSVLNGAMQLGASPLISSAIGIDTIEYPVYLITGGWTGNITLFQPSADGARVVFKRDGVAAAGAINLLPSGTTVDGSGSAITMTSAYAKVELYYSTLVGGWLNIT